VDPRKGFKKTHAQTWDPVSGMTVNRTVSSSSRTQAIFSRELSAATSSSSSKQTLLEKNAPRGGHKRKNH